MYGREMIKAMEERFKGKRLATVSQCGISSPADYGGAGLAYLPEKKTR